MAPHDPRSAYRDELNAARLRIDSLEAELESRRAGAAGGGRALEEAQARALELEMRARELEGRVRELERAATERAGRASARAAERAARRATPRAHRAAPAPAWPREFVGAALGFAVLVAILIVASSRLGFVPALIAVIAGSAASHMLYLWLSEPPLGPPGPPGSPGRAEPGPNAPRAAKPGPFKPYAQGRSGPRPAFPPPAPGATRTRFTVKRGRD